MPNETINELTPLQAYQLMQSDHQAVLIDIRSDMEYLFVGHPCEAVHIPWVDGPDWHVNPNFIEEVQKCLPDDPPNVSVPIILICRSGKRSLEAGHALLAAGMHNIMHVSEGFEGELNEQHQRSTTGGWRFHGLPWEQC